LREIQRVFNGLKRLCHLVHLPHSALTVEDCFAEIGRQVKENLKNADPIFGEIGSMMEDWIKAWKLVSS